MNEREALVIFHQLITQTLGAGLFKRVEDINAAQQAHATLVKQNEAYAEYVKASRSAAVYEPD